MIAWLEANDRRNGNCRHGALPTLGPPARTLNPLESAVLTLIRLGLKGDAASVRRFAIRMLQTPPPSDGSETELRESIAKLVLDGSAHRQLARRAPRELSGMEASPIALTRVDAPQDATIPVLPLDARSILDELIAERRNAEALWERGLEPTRTLLLTGAPGVGKTMTARYIASALSLPLLTVDLAAVVSSLLGKTGQNLRHALDFARAEPCVLLLDELDALGKRRDDPSDIGELKRIVNVLLLELEDWPAHGLLVAATNHPGLLDRAIWRRFEHTITIALPDEACRREILTLYGSKLGLQMSADDLSLAAAATEQSSGSDLARLVRETARKLVLAPEAEPSPGKLAFNELRVAAQSDSAARERYCILANKHLGWSQRMIAAELGLSHVTVGKVLRSTRVHSG